MKEFDTLQAEAHSEENVAKAIELINKAAGISEPVVVAWQAKLHRADAAAIRADRRCVTPAAVEASLVKRRAALGAPGVVLPRPIPYFATVTNVALHSSERLDAPVMLTGRELWSALCADSAQSTALGATFICHQAQLLLNVLEAEAIAWHTARWVDPSNWIDPYEHVVPTQSRTFLPYDRWLAYVGVPQAMIEQAYRSVDDDETADVVVADLSAAVGCLLDLLKRMPGVF